MSSDPTITPPPADAPTDTEGVLETLNTSKIVETPPEKATGERPRVRFSAVRWFFTGIVRVSYRLWTRVAARLFPEGSHSEQVAHILHVPLPDRLNMSWITEHLAVGGRVRSEDIRALARSGITHVVDTRSEYCDDADAMALDQIELL